MSRTDRPSSESYCPKIGRNLNHLGNWVFHIFEMEVESSTSDTISPMIGAAAMDSYYVLRCHRHIKFISLHSSPSKKCRFSNARMTSGRAGAPPLLCPIHVVVCLARAVREWLPCMEVQDFKADSRDDVRVRPGQRRRRSAERINANGSSLARSLAHSRSA